jgi:hypothetical protein
MSIVSAPPFDQMTLSELYAEHSRWVAATRPGAPMCGMERAHGLRDQAATWISRREREAGFERCFSCAACHAAIEFLGPVRRDAPDLRCTCGGELVADEPTPASVAA